MHAAKEPGSFLDRLHEQCAHPTPPEACSDHHRRELATDVIALDEVLHVEGSEAGHFALDLCDEQEGRRIGRDSLDPLSSLLRRRWIPELAEERGDRSRVPALGFANRYGGGGGGGASGGGPSSSTYVVLLRPHPPP